MSSNNNKRRNSVDDVKAIQDRENTTLSASQKVKEMICSLSRECRYQSKCS
jgi:hypothetical protein